MTDFFEGGPPGLLARGDEAAARGGRAVLGLAALDAVASRPTTARWPSGASPPAPKWRHSPRRGWPNGWDASFPEPSARVLLAFDDDALAALANKGLVRRARTWRRSDLS